MCEKLKSFPSGTCQVPGHAKRSEAGREVTGNQTGRREQGEGGGS